jgi:hypothetical protein
MADENALSPFGAHMLEAALQTAAGAVIIIDDKGVILTRQQRPFSVTRKASWSGTTSGS